MSVYDAEHTSFFMAFHPDLDRPGEWSKLVAATEPPDFRRTYTEIELGGRSLRLNGPDAPLWYVGTDRSVVNSVPDDLAEFLRTTPAWTAVKVTLFTNVVATDEARRPRLGVYTGRGKFAGCNATVTIVDIESGRISVSLTGSFEQFGLFYAAILSRKLKPAQWHEPKPHWVKPKWIKVVFGFRGHEPENDAERTAAAI